MPALDSSMVLAPAGLKCAQFIQRIQHVMYYQKSRGTYSIAGKFGELGESSMICQTKTIQINTVGPQLSEHLCAISMLKVFR